MEKGGTFGAALSAVLVCTLSYFTISIPYNKDTMQNKRNLLLLIGGSLMVLVVFFLIGLTIFTSNDPVPSSTPSTIKTEKQTVLTTEEELVLQEQITPLIKAGDMKACGQVQNDMYRKVCINNIALNKANETKDISYCQNIDGELLSKDACEQGVLFTKSVETKNVAICAEASNPQLKEQCETAYYPSLALKEQNPAACDQHPDKAKANECWNGFLAQKFTSGEKVECSNFRGEDVQADCSALIQMQEGTAFEVMRSTCAGQKTNTFIQICMMLGFSPNTTSDTYSQ